jgi:hypothetical protein
MAVKTNQYASPAAQDTGRGPSMSIWRDCPIEDFKQDLGGGLKPGYFMEDDFLVTNNVYSPSSEAVWGSYSLIGATGTVIGQQADATNLPLEGGVLGLLVTGGANRQAALSATGGGFGFVDASSTTGKFRGKMWFEACLSVSDVTAAHMATFVGLAGCASSSTPTSASGTLINSTAASGLATTLPLFGFFKPTTDGTPTGFLTADFGVVYNVAGGAVQTPGGTSTLQRLSTNYGPSGGSVLTVPTFTSGNFTTPSTMKIKLGWKFDPTPAVDQLAATSAVTTNQTVGTVYKSTIKFYVNGQQAGAFLVPADIQASTFPSKWMQPTVAVAMTSTGSGILYLDWWRCAQLGTY